MWHKSWIFSLLSLKSHFEKAESLLGFQLSTIQKYFTLTFLDTSMRLNMLSTVKCYKVSPYPVGKIAKKKVWRSAFLLIKRSKYSAMLSKPCCQKYTPTDCFFGDFVHWVRPRGPPHGLMERSFLWLLLYAYSRLSVFFYFP